MTSEGRMQLAIADSHYLMAFLARVQLIIEGEEDRNRFHGYSRQIAIAQQAATEGRSLSAEEQAGFWEAFIFLSNLGSPATIESIRYYFDYYGEVAKGVHRSRFSRSRYTWIVASVLVLCFVLSLVGFIGQRALDQYAADSRHWNGLVNIARLTTVGEALHAAVAADGRTLLIGTTGRAPAAAAPGPAVQTSTVLEVGTQSGEVRRATFSQIVQVPQERVARLRAALPGLLDSPRPFTDPVWHPACQDARPCVQRGHVLLAEEFVFTLAALHTERRILETLLSPVVWLHERLNPRAAVPPRARPSALPGRCQLRSPFEGMNQAPGDPAPLQQAAAQILSGAESGAERAARSEALMEDTIRLNTIFLFILCNEMAMPINLPPPLNSMMTMGFKADLALNVLNTYILTLLFGMLGACVHVMRDINRRLDDFTLTQAILNRYWARVILGGVSGAFIGLFFNAGGELGMVTAPGVPAGTLTSNLTGVALAFVAGFSVDVLFAILDRITMIFRDFAGGAEGGRGQPQGPGAPLRRVRVQ